MKKYFTLKNIIIVMIVMLAPIIMFAIFIFIFFIAPRIICELKGGKFEMFWSAHCRMPTLDGGKPCYSYGECEGECELDIILPTLKVCNAFVTV